MNALLFAVTGKHASAASYDGKTVYGRPGTAAAEVRGRVVKAEPCGDAGCSGVRLRVAWADGGQTTPCCRQCRWRDGQTLEIL